MKNLRLAIFVVGTTVMLWLGCSTQTYDGARSQGYGFVDKDDKVMKEDTTLVTDGAGTMDELDEVK